MADIFLSWTSANREAVRPLSDALKNFGFDLYNYEDDMGLGGQISDEVRAEIGRARVAVICFDDSTYQREWIITESVLCSTAVRNGTMKGIIPVWVGPHPNNLLPNEIRDYPAFDLEKSTPDRVLDLAWQIARFLPEENRHVVHAAVYAMTAEQYEEVRASDPVVGGLRFSDYVDRVCRYVGMPSRPELLDVLAARYGATAADVKPFAGGPTIVELVHDLAGTVNKARKDKPGSKLLFVRWVQDALNGPPGRERDEVNVAWQTGDSLLIVDSLSFWSTPVREEFKDATPNIDTSSIVWIPPFTHHTDPLYNALEGSWSIVQKLRNEFNRLEKEPTRNVTYEVTTRYALRRWLHSTLHSFDGTPRALPRNTADLPQPQSSFKPSEFWK